MLAQPGDVDHQQSASAHGADICVVYASQLLKIGAFGGEAFFDNNQQLQEDVKGPAAAVLADKGNSESTALGAESDERARPEEAHQGDHPTVTDQPNGKANEGEPDPAIFIRTEGADHPAPRVANEVTRLNGIAVGRIIRTLLEIQPPIGVRDLGQRAGVKSAGSVSNCFRH